LQLLVQLRIANSSSYTEFYLIFNLSIEQFVL